MTMITRNILKKQLPADVQFAMHELRLFRHLRSAGFTKRLGFSCACLFVLVFSLVFRQRNWYQIFDSAKGGDFPGKDAVYRFLNHPCFSWRRFLTLFSAETVGRVSRLTTATKRIKVFIIDDSMYERNRSKKVDHAGSFPVAHSLFKPVPSAFSNMQRVSGGSPQTALSRLKLTHRPSGPR